MRFVIAPLARLVYRPIVEGRDNVPTHGGVIIGSIPIERGTFGAAQASLDAALKILKDGQAFGIYPEGTRSRDGRLYRGKTGVGWLSLTAQVPVVPCTLIGTDKLQPIGSKIPRL